MERFENKPIGRRDCDRNQCERGINTEPRLLVFPYLYRFAMYTILLEMTLYRDDFLLTLGLGKSLTDYLSTLKRLHSLITRIVKLMYQGASEKLSNVKRYQAGKNVNILSVSFLEMRC